MKAVVGIDLGSTTCKAIVLSERRQIIGKGITNTRSNYTMAIDIATHEALTNARFSLLEGMGELTHAELVECSDLYHLADYINKHAALQGQLVDLARQRNRDEWAEPLRELGRLIDEQLRSPGTAAWLSDRSKFFKDYMYSAYLEQANAILPSAGLDLESFLGLLDKALVVVENRILPLELEQALRSVLPPAKHGLLDRLHGMELDVVKQVGTGYGRQLLPFPKEQIYSEIMCHAKGAHYFFPATATVLDIGGQDTKAIQLDDNGIVRSFFMNDRCAAGCGRYLGYVSEELAIGLSELGPSACSACKFVPITSTCTVFAGAELRDLLYAGEDTNEILLGLHRAIVLRAMSLLARSGGVFNEFTFTGGVAKNTAVVQVLRELVDKNYRGISLNIHADSIYMGALGAALYAQEAA